MKKTARSLANVGLKLREHCLFVALLWLAAAWLTTAASAQDSKQLTVDGVRGRWFPMETAVLLREEHLVLPHYKELATYAAEQQRVAEGRLAVKTEKLDLCLDDAELLTLAVSELKVSLLDEERLSLHTANELRAERRRARAWYRHPATWFAAGVFVTGTSWVLIERLADAN